MMRWYLYVAPNMRFVCDAPTEAEAWDKFRPVLSLLSRGLR